MMLLGHLLCPSLSVLTRLRSVTALSKFGHYNGFVLVNVSLVSHCIEILSRILWAVLIGMTVITAFPSDDEGSGTDKEIHLLGNHAKLCHRLFCEVICLFPPCLYCLALDL